MSPEDAPPFQLRPATADDRQFVWSLRVATMRRLIAESYGWDEAVQRGYADESVDGGRVVLLDGRPVGVVTLKDWPGEVHLAWVALLPDVQGRGLGRQLVRWAQAAAAARSKPLTLQVLPANPARALYLSLGFVETGRSARGDVRLRWQPEK